MLSDFDADTEYIDISIDGMDYGRCTPHRTGTQGKCFFHDCTEPNEDGASIPKRQLISENGTIYIHATSSGVDAGNDNKCYRGSVKTYTVLRITLTPSGRREQIMLVYKHISMEIFLRREVV